MQINRKCNICGSKRHTVLFPDFNLAKNGTIGLTKCLQCGLIFRNDAKDPGADIQDYAEKSYPALSNSWIIGRKKVFFKYLQDLEKYRKTNKILDIGAGHGFFLSSCKDKNWECFGIEPSKQCQDYAGKRFNINLLSNTLEDSDFEENSFDIITFWNVLDQLADPSGTLLRVNKLLRPGGLVLVRCSNWSFHGLIKRLSILLTSIHPFFLKLNKTVFHLYSFDSRSMTNILRRSNFCTITISPAHLSWTTSHNSNIKFKKQFIVIFIKLLTDLLYIISKKGLIYSPSFLATAAKKDTSNL